MPLAETYDVVVLGSGIAGLAAALAARESGLEPVLIEKAQQLGGTTSESYGLIWIGNNHLMRAEGETDRREDIVDYMTFLGGGELDESACSRWSTIRPRFSCSSNAAASRFASRMASSTIISA